MRRKKGGSTMPRSCLARRLFLPRCRFARWEGPAPAAVPFQVGQFSYRDGAQIIGAATTWRSRLGRQDPEAKAALSHPHETVRLVGLWALGRIGDPPRWLRWRRCWTTIILPCAVWRAWWTHVCMRPAIRPPSDGAARPLDRFLDQLSLSPYQLHALCLARRRPENAAVAGGHSRNGGHRAAGGGWWRPGCRRGIAGRSAPPPRRAPESNTRRNG